MCLGGQNQTPAALPPGKDTRCSRYRRLCGTLGLSGRVQENLPPPGFDPQTVQPVPTTLYILQTSSSTRDTLEDYCLLGCDVVQSGARRTFLIKRLPFCQGMQTYFSKLAMEAYMKRLYLSLTVHGFSYQNYVTTLQTSRTDMGRI